MTHLVAKIREHLIGGFLSQGGVPDDDALGGPEAVDGGVVAIVFSLAFIRTCARSNFLAGAAVTRWSSGRACGAFVESGSYLLNSGSIT